MSWKHDNAQAARRWVGPVEKYDLIQEGSIAVVVVLVLIVVLAILFGSPKVAGVTFQSWSQADPQDYAHTTLTELAGTSETANYGPPYNNGTQQLQSLGPISPQQWVGVRLPVSATQDFVIAPLTSWAALNPSLKQALQQWQSASASQQQAWGQAAISATMNVSNSTVSFSGGQDTGPIPVMLSGMLAMAQSGALDSQAINSPGTHYSTNYTKSLLYTEDSQYLGVIASNYHMLGNQWGIMNEIGSWPGQPWLWFYTRWYNRGPTSTIGDDIVVILASGIFFFIVFLLPFIPGLRSLPRGLRVYRLIWRPYYRKYTRR